MEKAVNNYIQSGGKIKMLPPKTKRIFKLVPKKFVKETEICGCVKRIEFMGKKYLRRMI